MGDATNIVLIFAGELLKRSEHLLTMGLHPSDVILGYEMALAKGREELESEYSSSQTKHHATSAGSRKCTETLLTIKAQLSYPP